jgi:hypothetical protein
MAYAYVKETLCRLVVDVKYGPLWGGWCSNVVNRFFMGLVFGKILGRVGRNFLDLLDLRWVRF